MGKTKEEMREYKRQWYLAHKEELNRRRRIRISDNIEGYRKYQREWARKHIEQNREEHLKKRREYYRENAEKERERSADFKRRNKEKVAEYNRQYKAKNKDRLYKKQKEDQKDFLRRNPNLRIAGNLRTRLRVSLISQGGKKSTSLENIVGCKMKDLASHIESQFTRGMSWDNYGRKGWHIDHIIPCAAFDLTNVEQQKKCFNWSNLQPLWATDNLKKAASLVLGDDNGC